MRPTPPKAKAKGEKPKPTSGWVQLKLFPLPEHKQR
jgi:hypothetical protein